MATVVAFAAVLSLLASSMRASDSLLGVTFARACAAEAATTNHGQAQLRVDRTLLDQDDAAADADDVNALAPPIEITKASAPPRESEKSASHRIASLASPTALPPVAMHGTDTGLRWLPVDPPARARARSMVFRN